jgi:inward rectifier potassium channel
VSAVNARHNKPRKRRKKEIRLALGDGRSRTPILWDLGDPYYWLMRIGWPAFIVVVVLVFLLINVIFGAVYALTPGSVANAAPRSLFDGFFFSVDTLATVGYGNMYPASRLGHAIASVEILLGLFLMATVTGLIFARFARPRKGLVFSRYAVIGPYEGQRALMVRAVWTRSYPLLDATAQLSWFEVVTQADGRTFRGLRELPLVRSHNPMMGLGWNIVHIIPEESDIVAAVEAGKPLLLTATVNGTDMLLASSSQAVQRYRQGDVRLDHEFAEMISADDNVLRLDFGQLDETQPLAAER